MESTISTAPKIIRILLVGDRKSGKTQLSNRYVDKIYNEQHIPVIGVEFKTKPFISPDTSAEYSVQIWDAAVEERFAQPRTKTYYKKTMGIVFVLDLTNPASLEFLKREMELVEQLAPEHLQKIVVGSKSDDAANRKISAQDAQDFVAAHGLPYFEVSARADQNVGQAMAALLRMIEPVVPHWDNLLQPPQPAARSGWCTVL